jgi:hypothetical protein
LDELGVFGGKESFFHRLFPAEKDALTPVRSFENFMVSPLTLK